MNRANWAILISLALVGLITPQVAAQQPSPANPPSVPTLESLDPAAEVPAPREPNVDDPTPKQPYIEDPTPKQPDIEDPAPKQPYVDDPTLMQPHVDDPTLKPAYVDDPTLKQPYVDDSTAAPVNNTLYPTVPETIPVDEEVFSYPVGTCCAVCGGGACCPDNFYTRQGARVLSRNKPRGVPISQNFNPFALTFTNVMNTRAIGFSGAAGYETTLGRYLGRDAENRDQFVEFTYWGLNRWRGLAAVRGTRVDYGGGVIGGSLFSYFDTAVGGFNRADDHTIFYDSRMHNYEFNLRLRPRSRADRLVLHPNGRWRRECRPGDYLSYLIGFRVFSFDENFWFHSTGLINVTPISGDYWVNSHNNLLGLQIGGDYIHRQCKWTYGFRFKVGPFINFCDQESRVITNDPLAVIALDTRRSAQDDHISLVGELGFITEYKLRQNFLLYAAYDFMWVTSLALAPEQLDFEIDPPSRINTNGLIYSHGLSLGFAVTW